MLTVKQVAGHLNVSNALVYKLVASGDLKCHRVGTAIRISRDQLREYLEGPQDVVAPLQVKQFRHLGL